MPEIIEFQLQIYKFAEDKNPNLLKILRERRKKDPEIEKGLVEVIEAYVKEIEAKRPEEKPKVAENIVSNIGRDVLEEATTKKEPAK